MSILIAGNAASKPDLSFFVELKGADFNALFSDTTLVVKLVEMKASLRVGLPDFSPERTEAIHRLNQAGIPLIAWLLLSEEEGYWFHMNNGDKAIRRYLDFKNWTIENNLKWEGIGIDLELDFNDARMGVKHPLKLAWKAYKRLYDNRSLENGKVVYNKLISQILDDGYNLESYVIPFIYDERISKTASFQKLLGLIDIQTPHEIPMVYTSVLGNPSMIASYCIEGEPIALGITGGGVVIEGIQPKFLTKDELIRDMLISNQYSSGVIIFCLEAAWKNGWLSAIESLDYTRSLPDLKIDSEKQENMRKTIQRLLIVLDHPLLMTIAVLLFITATAILLVRIFRFAFSFFRSRTQSHKSMY